MSDPMFLALSALFLAFIVFVAWLTPDPARRRPRSDDRWHTRRPK